MINKLLPFLILFTPQKHFEVYYLVILFFLSIEFFNKPKIQKSYLFIFSIISIMVSLRTLFFIGVDDYKELFKVSFFLFVLNQNHFNSSNYNFIYIKRAFLFFIMANLIVVLNQIFSFNDILNKVVYSIYLAESQQILLTYDNIRAPGLSPGVGQQGVIFLILSMFFWDISFKENSKINYLLFICSFVILFLSQSKSCFIGFLLFIMFRLFSLKSKYKFFSIPFIIYFIFYILSSIVQFFKEYDDLVKNFWSSSLTSRIENWMEFINPMIDNFILFFIGTGRNHQVLNNLKSSVFDSDFIYTFALFGFIGTIIFTSFILHLMKKFKNQKLILIIGFIVGLSINFFLEPKNFILILLVLSYLYKEHHEKRYILDTY